MKIEIEPEQESHFAAMLRGGGVAVWTNTDPIAPGKGRQVFTPAGAPAPENPGYGAAPTAIITSPDDVEVRQMKEHARIDIGDAVNIRGLNRRDMDSVNAALKRAGSGASWRSDWSKSMPGSSRHHAVILVPAGTRALNLEA